jgi:glutamate synthase (NADPH/NADH) large chain
MTKVEDTKALERAAQSKAPLGRDPALPVAQGLYDPSKEHDSCGVGFVANMHNQKSHEIVEMGLRILLNLDHRGAVGADPKLGDGCGILVQIPHEFFKAECAKLGIQLPAAGEYAIGQFFMPRDPAVRARAYEIIDAHMKAEGVVALGWRDLPVDSSDLGDAVRAVEPHHAQLFIGRGPDVTDTDDFERRIYLARKSASNEIYALEGGRELYSVSVSTRTIVYKGMVLVSQLGSYFLDLKDPRFVSALALVHQRFATNTFPSWRLAHPYRFVAHNGEINTLRGNLNWMAARQASVSSPLFGDNISKLWPISYEGQSDTANSRENKRK